MIQHKQYKKNIKYFNVILIIMEINEVFICPLSIAILSKILPVGCFDNVGTK